MTPTLPDFLRMVSNGLTQQVRDVLAQRPDWMHTTVRVEKHQDHWATEAIHWAATSGCLDELKILVGHVGSGILNVPPNLYRSALSQAAEYGHPECVRWLLEQGADPQLRGDPDEFSPFMYAAYQGHLDCAQLLFDPTEARRCAKGGSTALILAARNGHDDCVRFLLPHSDVLALDRRGNSALSYAAFFGNPRSVEALLPHSDPLVRNIDGFTPLMQAARNGHRRPDGNAAVIQQLLPLSDWERTSSDAMGLPAQLNRATVLSLIAQDGHLELLRTCLSFAPSEAAIQAAALNACQLAYERKHTDCAELLADQLTLSQAQILLESVPENSFLSLRERLPARIEHEILQKELQLQGVPQKAEPEGLCLAPTRALGAPVAIPSGSTPNDSTTAGGNPSVLNGLAPQGLALNRGGATNSDASTDQSAGKSGHKRSLRL